MSKRKVAYYLLAVAVIVSLVWIFAKPKNGAPTYEPANVLRGDVSHNVSVTGHIEPATRINLAFPVGGRISALPVQEGTQVLNGTVVAVLDGGILQSTLYEAQTKAEREQAVLRDLAAPLRSEERTVKSTAVENAQSSVIRAEESARATIARAFVYADDAVHEEADELFDISQDGTPSFGVTFTYGTTEYILQADNATDLNLNRKRNAVEQVLKSMSTRADNSTISITEALTETDADLKVIENFLTDLAQAINRYIFDDSVNQTVYESFQTSVATARTAIATARSEVASIHTTYTSALATLATAQSDLELSEAGASDDAIAAQKAMVASALAAVGTAQERAQDTVLTVPFDGVLARVDFEVGEIVSPYEPVAELITEGVYEVEAYIPEADIANLKLGDTAELTLDAYDSDDIFTAEVVRIAVSETVKEGVPTYKTTLRFLDTEKEGIILRPGMTADIEIHTDKRENVLYVPVRSVLRDTGRTYVRIFDGKEFQEVDIETGLRGSEGTIEVVSGLKEGDEVVLYVDEE